MNKSEPDKVIEKLTSQKETLKMAEFFSRRELTAFEKIIGIISTLIIYGTGFGFVIYILINLTR